MERNVEKEGTGKSRPQSWHAERGEKTRTVPVVGYWALVFALSLAAFALSAVSPLPVVVAG